MRRQAILPIKIAFAFVALFLCLSLWTGRATEASPTVAPIVVVVNDASPAPFGRYLGEILRAEGLNEFVFLNLSSVTLAELSQHQLVILAETPLTSGQATIFNNYVTGGGRIIAMRPDAQIASLPEPKPMAM